MNSLIGPIIQLAINVCGLIATVESERYIQELKEAQMSLAEESARGDDADDGKIEFLHKQIAITVQAINEQFALSRAPSSPSLPSHSS